jgi:hypothetical protein
MKWRVTNPTLLKKWLKENNFKRRFFAHEAGLNINRFHQFVYGKYSNNLAAEVLRQYGAPGEYFTLYPERPARTRMAHPDDVRDWLKAQGLNQSDIARALGTSRQSVNFSFIGKQCGARVFAYLRELGCPEEYLTGNKTPDGATLHPGAAVLQPNELQEEIK